MNGLQICSKTLNMGVYKILKDSLIILYVEHDVVVMTVGSQLAEYQFEIYGWPIFDPHFMKFFFRISGVIKL